MRKGDLTDEQLVMVEECPFVIKDLESFIKYKTREQGLSKFSSCRVGAREYNLKMVAKDLAAAILDLTQEEQDIVLKKYRTYQRLQVEVSKLRKKAYGGDTPEMKGKKVLDVLTFEVKQKIIGLFGRMYSIKEVHSILRDEYGIRVENFEVGNFFEKNIDEINRLRENHKKDFSHLRLSHKTSRLEELTTLYQKMRLRYNKSENREDHKVLLTTLSEIRKESEGDKLILEGNISMQIEHNVNLQVRNELLKEVSIKEIILSKLAAKTNVSVLRLLNSLNTSHYRKLNSLLGVDENDSTVDYPSQSLYDFDKIRDLNKKIVIEEAQIIEEEKKEKEEIKSAEVVDENFKNIMIERLKRNLIEANGREGK